MIGASISVAMTTFNGEAYLRSQLDSLAAQTRLPDELVVCDDGSDDETIPLLQAFSVTAPFPVRIVVNPQRLGYRANFVGCAGLCSGEWIAFCDQDDIWHADKLALMVKAFAADPDTLLVYHNAVLITADGVALHKFYEVPPSVPVAPRLTLPPWHLGYGYSLCFRRELLDATPFWPGLRDAYHAGQPMGHDLYFFMLAATLGSVAYLDEALVQYRQHAGQTIGVGAREAPGLLERWRYRLENRAASYPHLSDVAGRNAALFTQLAETAGVDWLRRRAADGARAWRALADIYAIRAEVVGAPLLRRWAAWRRLKARGAYGDGYWTFGRSAAAKDLLLGVALAPLIHRIGRPASEGDATCRRGASHALPV